MVENIKNAAVATVSGGAILSTVAAGITPGIATMLKVDKIEADVKRIEIDLKDLKTSFDLKADRIETDINKMRASLTQILEAMNKASSKVISRA